MSRDEYVISRFKYMGEAPYGMGPTYRELLQRDITDIDHPDEYPTYQGFSSCDEEHDPNDPDWIIGYHNGLIFGFKWRNRLGNDHNASTRHRPAWIRLPSAFVMLMVLAAFPHWVPHD